MLKFIKNIFLFTVVFLVINFLLKFFLDQIYFSKYIEDIDRDARTYLLSDSHGESLGEFNSSKIENFSFGSDSYFDIQNKLEFLIHETAVKSIVLSVDDHTLSPYRQHKNNLSRSPYYKKLSIRKIPFLIKYNIIFLEPVYGNLLRNYFYSILFVNNGNKKEVWSDKTYEEKAKSSKYRFSSMFEYNKRSQQLQNSLIGIIDVCEKNKINIIGLKFSLSPIYQKEIANSDFQADSLLKSKGYKIIDMKRFFKNDDLFKDQDHLNEKGAKIFKRALLDSLNIN